MLLLQHPHILVQTLKAYSNYGAWLLLFDQSVEESHAIPPTLNQIHVTIGNQHVIETTDDV